jgi:hypothetical protein
VYGYSYSSTSPLYLLGMFTFYTHMLTNIWLI